MYVDYKEVGKRIAARRKELGLKQIEVNEMAELSDKYLSNIETARSIPSIDVLMRICAVLKTTPDTILLGAVKNHENIDLSSLVSEKITKLDSKKQLLTYNFIDWIGEQDI
ncbi:MAG: helix-turn-helix transcriptional regulator [Clostridia bacterium]|nr:helix-turn-helix transcriptional regulator [Clostridia bacterium]